ncbi:hypothetical protein EYF80_065784 [Liparis tanakae]|uniref:Uncharacterized protein n=1 Tax=Liparis tanakae TaxID=230148 RepID=A0A4Z2E663_9TELE|nr:hypothetical protein EYF80_065784 [Liparis tanakae]
MISTGPGREKMRLQLAEVKQQRSTLLWLQQSPILTSDLEVVLSPAAGASTAGASRDGRVFYELTELMELTELTELTERRSACISKASPERQEAVVVTKV